MDKVSPAPMTRRAVIEALGAAGMGTAAILTPHVATAQGLPADLDLQEVLNRLKRLAEEQVPGGPQAQMLFLAQSLTTLALGEGDRRANAATLRTLAALNQPETQARPSITFGRATHFSKVLSRTKETSPADPSLPDEGGFNALVSILGKAFSGTPQDNGLTDFEALETLQTSIGEGVSGMKLRFTNPLGGLAYDLESLDPASTFIRAAPPFESRVTAAEMAELYYMALLRDLSLRTIMAGSSDPQVASTIEGLARYSYFRDIGGFTPETLFRADLRDPQNKTRFGFPGVRTGPYVSQFLFRGTSVSEIDTVRSSIPDVIDFGSLRVSLRQKTVEGGIDFLLVPDTNRDGQEWYAVQNGSAAAIGSDRPRPGLAYIATVRDGANYAHFDKIYQEYLVATCMMLADLPRPGDNLIAYIAVQPSDAAYDKKVATGVARSFIAEQGGIRDDILNFGNPYHGAMAQVGFATFGITQIVTLLAEVSTRAHKAGWYWKWAQLRIRPEEFGGRLHYSKRANAGHAIHGDLQSDQALLDQVVVHNQKQAEAQGKGNTVISYLLPMAYAEGCPTHPAYPSGHACVAGACVTILKAMFDETRTLFAPDNVYVPSDDGNGLMEVVNAPALTVGGELNKLASNISMFRTFGGVHWRSDQVQGMLVGEQVAVQLLVEQSLKYERNATLVSSYRERPDGMPMRPAWRFTLLSGRAIEIRDGVIYSFEKDVLDDYSGTYSLSQKDWGDATHAISFAELISTYQGNPMYPE